MPTDSRDIWFTIYKQVHEHHRESDKKRDQIIMFYLVLLAALIGAWKGLNEFQNMQDMEVIAALAALMVGLGSFWVSTQHWRWHIVYGCSITTLQRLMFCDKEPSLDECENAWNMVNNTDTKIHELVRPWRGVETAVMYLHAIMTFVPAYLLLRALWLATLQPIFDIISEPIAFILGAAACAIVLVFLSSLFVKRYHKFRKEEWMFRWLGCSTRS